MAAVNGTSTASSFPPNRCGSCKSVDRELNPGPENQLVRLPLIGPVKSIVPGSLLPRSTPRRPKAEGTLRSWMEKDGGVSCKVGPRLANLFHRKRLPTLPANDRASRRNELLRIRLRSRHSRNAHRGERNEHGGRADRGNSISYRSIIRHRRRYTYTYDRENARSTESPNEQPFLHLFAHAIDSPPWLSILHRPRPLN